MTNIETSSEESGLVLLLDDDPSIRKALENLLQSIGLAVHAFASAKEFDAFAMPDRPTCLVLDVRMPGRNGLDLYDDLRKRHPDLPVVFITGHGDIPMSVRAMKAGAIEFLTKPFREQDLLDAIDIGLARSRAMREKVLAGNDLRSRYATLTSREREVMAMILAGQLSKQIAARLGLSEITVKVCRAALMKKLGVSSLVELGIVSAKIERISP